jgi:hypothetical protein
MYKPFQIFFGNNPGQAPEPARAFDDAFDDAFA